MKFLRNFFYSFPVQLLILHFRKFQVLLIFWYILFSTIDGQFMKSFGANALFLAPEYLGNVNAAGAAIVGAAISVFIMSWNITTFILHSRRYRFLAATSRPFLKYCINNSIIPIVFLIFYFINALHYETKSELMPLTDFIVVAAAFTGGFLLMTAFSFVYFFRADKLIVRRIKPIAKDVYKSKSGNKTTLLQANHGPKSDTLFKSPVKV